MTVDEQLRTMRLIWLVLVGTALAYTLVVFILLASGTIRMEAMSPDLMHVVGAVVVVQLVAAVFVRRRLIAAIPDELPPEQRLSRYFNANIVGLALMEGGGLLVITFAMLSGAAEWALAGGGAACVLMLMARPSRDEIGV